MNRFVIGLFFLFALSAGAQSAPAGAAFTSMPQTIAVGALSETITIQAQDASGSTFKLPSTGCLALSSSASGEFSSSSDPEKWNTVSVLTMNKGTSNRSFFYRGTTAGTHTLTGRLVLKPESENRSCANWTVAEWPAGWTATQPITVGSETVASSNTAGESSSSSSSTPQNSEQTSFVSSGGSMNAPSEPVPSLVVNMSVPANISVGADATFSATVFGVKKEPIPNARVIWSFGNGATKEGASVRHAYNIPGSYAVMIDAASGGLAGSARATVVARKPDVRVSGVLFGANGFIEIENKSNAELDVSGWGIASGAILFTIPDHTIILPSAKVAFPSEVTKISLAENDARLLFPNGTLAAEYVPSPPVPAAPKTKPPLPILPPGGGSKKVGWSPSTTPAAVVLSVADASSNSGVGVWLWEVFGISVVGIGALAAFRLRPLPHKESDEKEFAKEIQIV